MRDGAKTACLLASTTLATFLLAGCGGGGGGGSQSVSIPAPPPVQSQPSSAPPTPPPPAPAPATQAPPTALFDTEEYRRSNSAASHGAIKAYEKGASGKGVTVAVLDSGVNGTLPAFRGRIAANSQDVVWDGAFDRGISDTIGHGTAVASIIAGAKDGQSTMGVAFESTILSLNTATCDAWRQCQHFHSDLAKALDIARDSGARIVNMSLGGDGMSGELLSAIDRATTAGMVIVISAGNDGQISPSDFALAAARDAGKGRVIIAGAMDGDRRLADFSNAAGAGADWFLVALGAGVNAHDQNGQAGTYNGTSYSAPVISGAAALLAGAFPHLTGGQIVEILLTTADDAGPVGDDYLYGQGILNIERAFAPLGEVKLAGLSAVVLDGYRRAYRMDLPTGIGQAPVSRPLGGIVHGGNMQIAEVSAGPLALSVTSLRGERPDGIAHAAAMRLGEEQGRQARLVAGIAMSRLSPRTRLALGLSESGAVLQRRLADAAPDAFLVARGTLAQSGFRQRPGNSLGMRHALGGTGLTLTSEHGRIVEPWLARRVDDEPGYRASSVTLDRRVGPHALTLGITRMTEARTLLGGAFSADYYRGRAASTFVDAGADLALGNGWTSSLAWRAGRTGVPSSGMLVDGGALWTNAFSFDLARTGAFSASDRIAFRVSQPLRVETGGLSMRLPVSYDYATGGTGFGRHMLNLAPTGREIDYEVSYAAPMLGGSLAANAFARTQPGHVAARGADVGAVFRFNRSF